MNHISSIKAIAAVAATLVATGASAYSYSVSHLKVTDLSVNAYITLPNGTKVNNAALPGTYTFGQTNSASLLGSGVVTNKDCVGSFNANGTPAGSTCGNSGAVNNGQNVLDAAVANAPGSTVVRAQNDFTHLGFASPGSYSSGDSVLYTAELPQIQQGKPATSMEMIAESLLNANGSASANAGQTSETGLKMTYAFAGGTGLELKFSAILDLLVKNFGDAGIYSANSDVKVGFTLTNETDGGSIFWNPNGLADGNCFSTIAGATCSELLDGGNLNAKRSSSVAPGQASYGFASSNFGIDIKNLTAGAYSLVLNASAISKVTRQVPEPDALALLGIALAGLAFVTKRKSAK